MAEHGGKASGGNRPEELIDGNSTLYDGTNGYGYTYWNATPAQSLIVELREASKISCVRFLLWDGDDRFYRYKLELSPDGQNWGMASDKTGKDDEWRSWQVVRFPEQIVKYIRLTGTYNSANSGFHVVELQACIFPPDGFDLDRKVPTPNGKKPSTEENLVF